MTARRGRFLAAALLLLAVLLLLWTLSEARHQRRAVEEILTTQALVLARSLGPGLAAASHAARELDEIVLWKLLDNARMLAHLGDPLAGRREVLEELVEANGLEAAAFFHADGSLELDVGEVVPPATAARLVEILDGRADELVLGSSRVGEHDHLEVAVARPGGGAVMVAVHTSTTRAFAQRLGVDNLLASLVGSGGVLYLRYGEEPTGRRAELSWDQGPIPAGEGAQGLISLRDRSVFAVEVPVEAPAGRRASLQVGLDGAPLEAAAVAAMRRSLLVGIVLLSLAVVGTGFAVVSRLRTLEREEAAQRLAAAETARRRSERLAAAGALTAGLAHEVRSPMNAMGLAAQRLVRKLPEGTECREIAGTIRGELQRLDDILREFLELATPVSERREAVDLEAIGDEVRRVLAPEAEAAGVRLPPVAGRGRADVDRQAIQRAVVNLVRNAIQASPSGGEVSLSVREESGQVILEVRDKGPGIDAELSEQLFDAFVTHRAEGTGLGLALARRVAEEHGGSLHLVNRSQQGARAVLTVPREGGQPT